MAKKRDHNKKKDEEAPLPKFGGFHPLAGGLEGFKAKLDAEKQAEQEKQKAAGAKGKPLPAPASGGPGRAAAPPAQQPRRPAEPATSAADDEMSFHRMMSGVKPLEAGATRVPRTTDIRPGEQRAKAAEVQARAQVEAEQALAHLHSIVDDVARFEVTDDGKRVEGRRVDAAPDLVRSLRRGSLPIDGRLDLHGLTSAQAQERLVEFLRTMRTRNERCVLVIHGKGERAPGGGVLRGEIAAWLSQGKAREHVAAFVTARDEDGGEGALYVAVRR